MKPLQVKHHIKFPCHPRYMDEIRQFAARVWDDLGVPQQMRFQLDLVLDEACMNAIDHGSRFSEKMTFSLGITRIEDDLIFLIKDQGGKPFDPDYFQKMARRGILEEGGRGIFLINQMMDEVIYLFNPNKSTSLYLSKRLDGTDEKK